MPHILLSGNARLYVVLAAGIALAVAWKGGEALNARLAGLAIKQAPRVSAPSAPLTEVNFYPVWVKQPQAIAANAEANPVDALFARDEPAKPPPAPPEPDYAAMLQQAFRFDGAADDGVFANGRFYGVGRALEDLTMTSPTGRRVVPRLEQVDSGRATFSIGRKRMVLTWEKRG